MSVMAAVCGVMIVLLGFWSAGSSPTDAQSVVEIVCLVGGLILCFMAVVLSRLKMLSVRLDGYELAAEMEQQAAAALGNEEFEPAVPGEAGR